MFHGKTHGFRLGHVQVRKLWTSRHDQLGSASQPGAAPSVSNGGSMGGSKIWDGDGSRRVWKAGIWMEVSEIREKTCKNDVSFFLAAEDNLGVWIFLDFWDNLVPKFPKWIQNNSRWWRPKSSVYWCLDSFGTIHLQTSPTSQLGWPSSLQRILSGLRQISENWCEIWWKHSDL